VIESRNAAAWRMLCLRWRSRGHWFEESVTHADRPAFDHLVGIKALKPFVADNRYVLCGYCGLHTAQVYRQGGSMELNCPDCGPVQVTPGQFNAWVVNAEWLIRKLRVALAIPAQDATVAITSDVWRLGQYQRRPVFLARSLDAVLHHPSVIARAVVDHAQTHARRRLGSITWKCDLVADGGTIYVVWRQPRHL